MPNAQSLVREYFGPLRGLPCWHVTAEYGSWLSLRFGQPHLKIREADPRARVKTMQRRAVFVEGDFLLWVELGAWQLMHGAEVAFHSEQSRAYLRRAAARLDGQKLTHIKLSPGKPETEFTFDSGSTLVVRPADGAEPEESLWHVYSESKCLSLLAGGALEYGSTRRSVPRRVAEIGSVSYAA
jgi:hypothetical protein